MNLREKLCCACCGRRPFSREHYHRGFEYHHALPVRAGGTGVAENVVLLCKHCHRLADTGHLMVPPEALCVPESVPCQACGQPFDVADALVNCGWYECPECRERTHLYDHFGYG